MVLNDATRAALTSGKLAHLVMLNPDGSPQVSVVYVGLDAVRHRFMLDTVAPAPA